MTVCDTKCESLSWPYRSSRYNTWFGCGHVIAVFRNTWASHKQSLELEETNLLSRVAAFTDAQKLHGAESTRLHISSAQWCFWWLMTNDVRFMKCIIYLISHWADLPVYGYFQYMLLVVNFPCNIHDDIVDGNVYDSSIPDRHFWLFVHS